MPKSNLPVYETPLSRGSTVQADVASRRLLFCPALRPPPCGDRDIQLGSFTIWKVEALRFRQERQEHQTEKKETAKVRNRHAQIEFGLHPRTQPDQNGRRQQPACIKTKSRTGCPQVRGKKRGKIYCVAGMDALSEKREKW